MHGRLPVKEAAHLELPRHPRFFMAGAVGLLFDPDQPSSGIQLSPPVDWFIHAAAPPGALWRVAAAELSTWNRFLERDEVHLMWARAEGIPWKHHCCRFGISRPTAHRRYDYALSVIACRPLSLQAMTLSAYCHRRCAVGRLIPNR